MRSARWTARTIIASTSVRQESTGRHALWSETQMRKSHSVARSSAVQLRRHLIGCERNLVQLAAVVQQFLVVALSS